MGLLECAAQQNLVQCTRVLSALRSRCMLLVIACASAARYAHKPTPDIGALDAPNDPFECATVSQGSCYGDVRSCLLRV